MLGRKTYEPAQIDAAEAAVARQLAAYRGLDAVPDGFEATYFNALAVALDPPFVPAGRGATGKDTNALNELELIVDSLTRESAFDAGTVIRYRPEESALG